MTIHSTLPIRILSRIYDILLSRLEFLYFRFLYSGKNLKVHLKQKRFLIANGEDLNDLTHNYRKFFPAGAGAKTAEADVLCDHVFDLLGSGPTRLSPRGGGYQPIRWHCDFKSGYCWDQKTFYSKIRFGQIHGTDVKVPWELSRFQHLNMLGQAYILTRNKKYAEEFADQVRDWRKNNPLAFGINWKCTMDVAIRVSNWLVAMEYFSEDDVFQQEFLAEFYSSVYEHGKFIRNHLENKRGFTHNHYVTDLVGLFFISVYCPFFEQSKKWQKFAIKGLLREIKKQVYDDGCDFEASTSYHRLVLELFFYAELLGKRAGVDFPDDYKRRLRKMFEFSLYSIKPNGMVPQIGDNDSGRFLIFSRRPVLEQKYLLTLATIHYKDSNFKIPYFDYDEEAFWVFGSSGKRSYEELKFRDGPIPSKAFPESGWYIIRNKKDYCFVSCGPNGQHGRGGHSHNDKLSFELMIDGQDVIVDPGSFVYTSDPVERNKFRSTEYHNTIRWNGLEQNDISEKDIFLLSDRVKIKEADLREEASSIIFKGTIEYEDVLHRRMITLDVHSSIWKMQDRISSPKRLEGKLLFHLAPGLFSDKNGHILDKAQNKIATLETDGSKAEKEEYDYSSEYGVRVKAECLFRDISASHETKTIHSFFL